MKKRLSVGDRKIFLTNPVGEICKNGQNKKNLLGYSYSGAMRWVLDFEESHKVQLDICWKPCRKVQNFGLLVLSSTKKNGHTTSAVPNLARNYMFRILRH